MKVAELRFSPDSIECPRCPPEGCDLSCAWPAPVTRPDGRLYRARKVVEVAEFTDTSTEMIGVVVLRTHDVEQAKRCAAAALAEYELDATEARLDWWRVVPWDSSGMFDRSYISDSVRGVPCVVFEPL